MTAELQFTKRPQGIEQGRRKQQILLIGGQLLPVKKLSDYHFIMVANQGSLFYQFALPSRNNADVITRTQKVSMRAKRK